MFNIWTFILFDTFFRFYSILLNKYLLKQIYFKIKKLSYSNRCLHLWYYIDNKVVFDMVVVSISL